MPSKRAKAIASARIESHRHKDTRKNIPTEELRDFVVEDEQKPKAMLYPRDPSLDPQLVWKGKDEQDSKPLEVPTVPIYIQEKLHPQATIEDFRSTAAKTHDDGPDLFADFNGLPQDFEKRIDFYHYDGHWSNRLILGDSLLVMNSLAEKEGLKGKVQMIYFDPPYGIKFGSNWQVSTRKRDVKDGKQEDVSLQPEQVKAFRDTWELGIHSYLAYLRDRLTLARELLSESGSVFVQMGDENVHLVRSILDEVFGAENCIGIITVRKTGGTTGGFLPATADFILWYAKNRTCTKYHELFRLKDSDAGDTSFYDILELPTGARRRMTKDELAANPSEVHGRRLQFTILTSPRIREARTGYFPIDYQGTQYLPTAGEWKTHRQGINRLVSARRIDRAGSTVRYVRYLHDFPATSLTNTWTDVGGASDPTYVVQTNTRIIERCLLMTTDPGDLVLDPTCGSGTTAYVAEQWGRRWITTDTSRVAITLARTRLMTGRFPYFILADSDEGRRKESEITGKFSKNAAAPTDDIRQGFVFRRIPHVTLKSIANNEEIDTIHEDWKSRLYSYRQAIGEILRNSWEEWEVPRETDPSWPKRARELHKMFWDARIERQKEIDASIARRADTEILYDQPYEDPKRLRVTGPFTVESLSPHRTISFADKKDLAAGAKPELAGRTLKTVGPDQFGHMILENLRTTPVMGMRKNERIKFETIEPYPGLWIQGEGHYTDSDGKSKRVAICIGPEHGTIGPELLKEAAKEAVQGVGFHLLLILGFAFDPHVSEEAKRYGKLSVLPVRLNPDLMMGELLKKTGAANLFMVFGEPDIDIKRQKDERVVVEIKGLDVYDPTTGEIRSSSTDEIACWLIDTNYNGESFFVRHAYFTGAGEPYEKLKRALRAEIDEGAWSALYSTKSRPFAAPKTGKIAVKVINHYGDEVLKVYKL